MKLVALVTILAQGITSLLGAFYEKRLIYQGGEDPGDPLYLSPYILDGQINQAREMSRSVLMGRTSYAGFFTVNEVKNSNMYFWFFPSPDKTLSAPLLLWLQGGPGSSSLFGLFNENGPYVVDKSGNPSLRPWSWNTNNHMLYIDNPVGTGFSFTLNKSGYATNERDIAENLYSCLTQFFTIFSEYQKNDFYITGESYAGKYIPAIGYKIHTANKNRPEVHINLKGIAIGNGFCDPENMVGGYGELAFQLGLLDEKQKAFVDSQSAEVVSHILKKDFAEAFSIIDRLNGDTYKYHSYFHNVTGFEDFTNILRPKEPLEFDYYLDYINQPSIRKLMKVGKLPFYELQKAVEKALIHDLMDNVRDWLAVLMDNYKVLLYSGQLDLIVGPVLTERFLQVLEWSGNAEYLRADRKVWKIGEDLAGYIRSVDNFYQVIVLGGGHILPYDQPERAYELIELFVSGKIKKHLI